MKTKQEIQQHPVQAPQGRSFPGVPAVIGRKVCAIFSASSDQRYEGMDLKKAPLQTKLAT